MFRPVFAMKKGKKSTSSPPVPPIRQRQKKREGQVVRTSLRYRGEVLEGKKMPKTERVGETPSAPRWGWTC